MPPLYSLRGPFSVPFKVIKTFFNDIEEETTRYYIFIWISGKAQIWDSGWELRKRTSNRPESLGARSQILAFQNIPVHAMGWYKISQLNIWDST